MQASEGLSSREIIRDSNPNLSTGQMQKVQALGQDWNVKCAEGNRKEIEVFIKTVVEHSDYHVAKQFFMENNVPPSGALRQQVQDIWKKAEEHIDYYAHVPAEEKMKLEQFDEKWSENSRNRHQQANTQLILDMLADPKLSISSISAFYEKQEIFPEGRFRSKPEIIKAEDAKTKGASTVGKTSQSEAFANLRTQLEGIIKNDATNINSMNSKKLAKFLTEVLSRNDLSKEEKLHLFFLAPKRGTYALNMTYLEVSHLKEFGFAMVFSPTPENRDFHIDCYCQQVKKENTGQTPDELKQEAAQKFDASLRFFATLH